MGTFTPTEQAPAYDDLFEAPANAPNPSTSGLPFLGKHSKYARLATEDQPDIENDAHEHGTPLESLPASQPHAHCNVCDRQMERRERRKAQQHCCAMVSRTFVLIALFLMAFGIVAVVTSHKGH